jgi:hypothetical protein
MHISDYPVTKQLHADRTARLVRSQRPLRLPKLPVVAFFHRKERQAVDVRPATAA